MDKTDKMFLCFMLYGICMTLFKHSESPYVDAVCLFLSSVAIQISNWRKDETQDKKNR